MNKVRILSIISTSLLVVNLFLIWSLVSHRPAHGNTNDPKKVIIEKLHLDEAQITAYEKLIDAHRHDIHQSEQKLMLLKNDLYITLKNNEQRNTTDSIIAEIGTVQNEIEHINYRHFQDIKRICNAEQQDSFNELCNDIAKLFSRQPPRDEKH